jgi:predicted GIY-YIG superfamily endonuclease
MSDPGYLYILQSASGDQCYIGSCVDPDRRLGEHMNGHVKATAGKGPWRRAALLSFTTAALARKAEYWLKRLRRREYTDMIIGGTFDWHERFGLVAIEEPAK